MYHFTANDTIGGLDSAQTAIKDGRAPTATGVYNQINFNLNGVGAPFPGTGTTILTDFAVTASVQIFLTAGTYIFQFEVDDGARLSLDGNVIVNTTDNRGYLGGSSGASDTFQSLPHVLTAGYHTFQVLYTQNKGNAVLSVKKSTDNGTIFDLLEATPKTLCVLPNSGNALGQTVCSSPNTTTLLPVGSSCTCETCQCKFTDNNTALVASGSQFNVTAVFLQCVDCSQTPGGTLTYDVCDVCDGDGTTCKDCNGRANGNATYDSCDVCGGDSSMCATCQATCPFTTGRNGITINQCRTARVGNCTNGWLVQEFDLSGTNGTVAAMRAEIANGSAP